MRGAGHQILRLHSGSYESRLLTENPQKNDYLFTYLFILCIWSVKYTTKKQHTPDYSRLSGFIKKTNLAGRMSNSDPVIHTKFWKKKRKLRHPMGVRPQVLTTLGFLATGTFQRNLADRLGISQPTFSHIMQDMLTTIIGLSQQYINVLYTGGEQASRTISSNVPFPQSMWE